MNMVFTGFMNVIGAWFILFLFCCNYIIVQLFIWTAYSISLSNLITCIQYTDVKQNTAYST